MREIEIKLANIEDTPAAIARIENAVNAHGLTITSRGSLKSYPGCTHWHCKRGREKGTLEITFWPAKKRAWFKVQAAREAPWIDELLPILMRAMASSQSTRRARRAPRSRPASPAAPRGST
jgi:hypothetical protein